MPRFFKSLFMLKASLSLVVITTPMLLASAEDVPAPENSGGTHSAHFTANMTQVSFDNWEAGGEDAMSWQVEVDEKSLWEVPSWKIEGEARFAFGRTQLGESGYRKSLDELKLGLTGTMSKNLMLNPFASINLSTQFSDGYIYDENEAGEFRAKASEFFSPAVMTESAGMGMEWGKVFTSRFGFAAKQTFSKEEYHWADDPDTEKIETLRSEVGLSSDNTLKLSLNENVSLESRLQLFSALTTFDEIDCDWDTSLKAALGKGFQMTFNVHILRDADISRKRQFKQNFTLGWSTRLF
jgi:hypothetical protein